MLKFACILAFIGLASAFHGHSGYSHVIKHDSHYGGHNEHYTGGYYGNGHHNTGHYGAGHYSGHHGDHYVRINIWKSVELIYMNLFNIFRAHQITPLTMV